MSEEKFSYMPQMIVAYDGDRNDEFANLIHVTKAQDGADYYCPCCNGIVRSRAKNSQKVQPHYYHITGECTKESQIHWFCKNWLFGKGSKFYVGQKLYEVVDVEVEKTYDTSFGKYKPDITVHTNDGDIFFEMFFSNRKNGTDYFCKWKELNVPVVEVNLKEYMCKISQEDTLSFSFIYNDGECYSEKYKEKDVYYNATERIKNSYSREEIIEVKRRIEKFDKFWSMIDKGEEEILDYISTLDYDEIEECYNVSKEKRCLNKLLGNIIKVINEKILADIKSEIEIEETENIFLDCYNIRKKLGIGVRLYVETKDITYDKFYGVHNIVSSGKIHKRSDIVIDDDFKQSIENNIKYAHEKLDMVYKLQEEIDKYDDNLIIKMNNNLLTVLSHIDNHYELLIDKKECDLCIDSIAEEIDNYKMEKEVYEEIQKYYNTDEYKNIVDEIKLYGNKYGLDITIDLQAESSHMCYNIYNRGKYIGKTIFVSEIKKIILRRKKEIDGYKYYVEQLKKSPYYKVKEFVGKYDDPGIVISDINNISRKVIFIRQHKDDYYDIEKKFTTAMKEIKEEVEKWV